MKIIVGFCLFFLGFFYGAAFGGGLYMNESWLAISIVSTGVTTIYICKKWWGTKNEKKHTANSQED